MLDEENFSKIEMKKFILSAQELTLKYQKQTKELKEFENEVQRLQEQL